MELTRNLISFHLKLKLLKITLIQTQFLQIFNLRRLPENLKNVLLKINGH